MFTYLKLKFYKRFQKRFVLRKTKILNYSVYYNDPRSLFSEYKIIFYTRAYYFHSEQKSPVIIDGGGHIGLTTLYFKNLYPNARIKIFEPDSESLEILRKNIITNNLRDVEIIQAGLYSYDGQIGFTGDNTDGGRINESVTSKINVEKLSKYIDSEIDFMKLNIEGSELEVLKDLIESGKINKIREMCLEWHSFANQKQNLGELLSILEKNNFKYLVNHFDYKINRVLKPPFKVSGRTQYYLLIYARQKSLT